MEGRSSQQATRVIARGVATLTYEELPPRAVETVKQVVMDTLGAALAGSGLGQGAKSIVSLVEERGGKPESTIVGFGTKVPCSEAALANSALAHALDYDDVYGSIQSHLDAVTVPVALAVAERAGRVSGKELITAIALGDEVTTRLGMAIFKAPKGFAAAWHPGLLIAYFGATATAGRLLGLSEEAFLHAFGIALYRTGGTLAFLGGARNLVAEVYYGFPAQIGVMSALMARKGITGPLDALEGNGGLFPAFFNAQYDRGSLISGFGKDFHFTNVGLKAWPTVRTSHCYIQAALGIVSEKDVRLQDVDEIVLHCGPVAQAISEPLELRRRPATPIDARFSIPFGVAVAVANKGVTLRDFLPENMTNSRVLGLVDKVTIKPDPDLDSGEGGRGSGSPPAIVEIRTRDGTIHSKRVDVARGEPGIPLSHDELTAKFKECASYAARPLHADKVDRIIDLISTLETMPEISPLGRLLC